jgi:hypothetical protein
MLIRQVRVCYDGRIRAMPGDGSLLGKSNVQVTEDQEAERLAKRPHVQILMTGNHREKPQMPGTCYG